MIDLIWLCCTLPCFGLCYGHIRLQNYFFCLYDGIMSTQHKSCPVLADRLAAIETVPRHNIICHLFHSVKVYRSPGRPIEECQLFSVMFEVFCFKKKKTTILDSALCVRKGLDILQLELEVWKCWHVIKANAKVDAIHITDVTSGWQTRWRILENILLCQSCPVWIVC